MNLKKISLPYSLLLNYLILSSLPYPTLPEVEKPLLAGACWPYPCRLPCLPGDLLLHLVDLVLHLVHLPVLYLVHPPPPNHHPTSPQQPWPTLLSPLASVSPKGVKLLKERFFWNTLYRTLRDFKSKPQKHSNAGEIMQSTSLYSEDRASHLKFYWLSS